MMRIEIRDENGEAETTEPEPNEEAQPQPVIQQETPDTGQDGDTEDGASEPVVQIVESMEEIVRKADERDKFYESLVKLKADFSNFRKRAEREREKAGMRARRGLMLELLPILDKVSAVAASAEKDEDVESLRQVVKIVSAEWKRFEETAGLATVETASVKFDPSRHEAMAMEERSDVVPGTVVKEIRSGYTLNGELLRPAQVVVSSAPAAAEDKDEEPEGQDDEGKKEES